MAIAVIDAGHGGTAEIGGSSPNNARGPCGLLEKTVTLELARRVSSRVAEAGIVARLTRDADVNLGLHAHAAVARRAGVDVFVSIHLNGHDADHFRATAFRVRDDLIVTDGFALNDDKPPPGAETATHAAGADPRIAGLTFCAGHDALTGCPNNERRTVTEVVLDGGPDSRIVVLRLGAVEPSASLQLRDTARAADTLVDQYAYIIPYPIDGPAWPPAFAHALLGGNPGVKQLLPGRTLTLEHDGAGAAATTITTDSNTSVGTAGASLVDLLTAP
jgi:hypothetical protein